MRKRFNKLKHGGIVPMLCLFLCLSQSVNAFLIRSTNDTDSTCLCGPRKDIDSLLKIAQDYPELLRQSDFYEKQVGDMRTLSELERGELLALLDLEKWDFKKVKRRVRWQRARAFIRGAMVGAAAAVTVALLVPK